MNNYKVLVAIPAKADMHPSLQVKMRQFAGDLVKNNPGFDVEICIFTEPFKQAKGTVSIFSKPAQARNALIAKHLKPHHDYVLWMDADIVFYTSDTILRLQAINPDGVTAPLVLIECAGKSTDNHFYDVAAFVESGQPVFAKPPHFGNVQHRAPYFVSPESVVPCESVGCAYLIPAAVHREGVLFEPTPFTDHFPVIRKAIAMGMPVVTSRVVIAYHAYLPNYGEKWHAEPMEPWAKFDFAKYNLAVAPGSHTDRERANAPPAPRSKSTAPGFKTGTVRRRV